jgi:hypothetical protein
MVRGFHSAQIAFMLLLTFVFSSAVKASAISDEQKRLQRCYGMFTGERILTTDALWIAVTSGAITGTVACMEVLDHAKLDANGNLAQTAGVYDAVGAKVLRTFLDFNRSQLQVPDYGVSFEYNQLQTQEVTDANESVYHELVTLFKTGEKYSNLVTRNYTFRANRYSTKTVRTRSLFIYDSGMFVFNVGDSTCAASDSSCGLQPWSPLLAQTGTLVGMNQDLQPTHIPKLIQGMSQFIGQSPNQTLGAGMLGTESYIFANAGKSGSFTDGGITSFRRWSKNVMADTMCRSLPALRSTDVLSEVALTSALPYRQGISCMGCHSTMDPMAGVIRNSVDVPTRDSPQGQPTVMVRGTFPVTQAAADYPTMAGDPNFYLRPPIGRLMFRSYDGTLVKVDAVQNIADMGTKIAATNDLYVCAAKRYYEFLTGISANLQDPGDINAVTLSSGDQAQRDKVIALGLSLKNDPAQSLRTLIQTIISSPTFLTPDTGV